MPRTNKFTSYLQAYRDYYARHRTIPNFSQTQVLMQVSSMSAVHRFHQQLVVYWYLTKIEWSYHAADKLDTYEYFESVQAGFPSPATDDLKGQINLDRYLIHNPLSTIFVKVTGDSMVDAGILPNDIIIVEKWAKHLEWQIVVAVVDGDYTVKYLAKNMQWYYLKAANSAYPDIIPQDKLEIFGVVVGSFRTYY